MPAGGTGKLSPVTWPVTTPAPVSSPWAATGIATAKVAAIPAAANALNLNPFILAHSFLSDLSLGWSPTPRRRQPQHNGQQAALRVRRDRALPPSSLHERSSDVDRRCSSTVVAAPIPLGGMLWRITGSAADRYRNFRRRRYSHHPRGGSGSWRDVLWWSAGDSNPRPRGCEPRALTS